jgi:hypothetical protein
MTTTPAEPLTYSENEAATILEHPRSTLAYWRKQGYLRPDLVLGPQRGRGPSTGRPSMRYDKSIVDGVAAGTEPLFGEDLEAEQAEPDPDAWAETQKEAGYR